MRISDWSSDVCSSDLIASGVIAAMRGGPPGVYNLADDFPCSQNRVIEYACALLNVPLPPLQSLAEARLSRQGRAFYGENRRIANGKAQRLLGWRQRYRDYRAGLRDRKSTRPHSSH